MLLSVVRGTGQKESLAAQKAPLAAADQEMIQRGSAPRFRGRRIQRDRTKLKREADSVIRQERKNVRREIQHHQVRCVLLAHQPARQQRKSRLHEEHQISGQQRPGKIRADARVSHTVRQFQRQRFLRGLRLKLIKVLLDLRDSPELSCPSAPARRMDSRRRQRPKSGRPSRFRRDPVVALLRVRDDHGTTKNLRKDEGDDRSQDPLCRPPDKCTFHFRSSYPV